MLGSVLAQAPEWDVINQAFGGQYKFGSLTQLSAIFNLGLVNIIFFIAGAAFLLYIVTGGLSLMLSRGDPKAVEAGKARITYALYGFIIIFAAYWIVQVIGLLLGLQGFGGIFGGGGGIGDGSCAMQCPVNTICQNGACVIDPN